MMVRGQFAQLMAPGIHHNFVEWLDLIQREQQYTEVFNVENSTKAFEDEVQFVGLGPAPEKTENDQVVFNDAIQGGTKRYVMLTYALGCQTSWELYNDDQYGIIKQVPKALARSMRFTEEMVPWNVFNLGFSSVTVTDGRPLFYNQHPLQGGAGATNIAPGVSGIVSLAGTYPNRPAVDMDISQTAIQLMATQFRRMPDSMGLPVTIKPKTILVPPETIFIMRELLGSPGKPYTANNEINALLGEGLDWRAISFLTSSTAWFVVAEKSSHQVKFFWRHKPDSDYDDDFKTRAMMQVSFMRFAAGATDWKGTWGSNGP